MFAIQLTWTNYDEMNPHEVYGSFLTTILYLVRFLSLLALPQCLCNLLGLTIYNAFPDKVQLKGSPLLSPLICVRTVTRGDFPELVRNNVNRNMNTCLEVGLDNFMMEVVSDKPLDLPKHPRIREVVVPRDYRTRTGAMFKVS